MWVYEQGDMQKVVSNEWCKESSETPKWINSAGSTWPIVVVGSFLHCLKNFVDVNISKLQHLRLLTVRVTIDDLLYWFSHTAVHIIALWRLIQTFAESHPFGFQLSSDLHLYMSRISATNTLESLQIYCWLSFDPSITF